MNERRFYEGLVADDARRSAPAAQRNREAIADVLADWLPKRGKVLEVASGTGEHAVWFAERFPNLDWQPSDTHPDALASIGAWCAKSGSSNVRWPVVIDARSDHWPVDRSDAVININMAHISPWNASLGLIKGARRLLPTHGSLILYGPWLKEGIDTAPTNTAFDADLRRRDASWGLRRVEDFADAAAAEGLEFVDWRQMPANNLMLLFRQSESERT